MTPERPAYDFLEWMLGHGYATSVSTLIGAKAVIAYGGYGVLICANGPGPAFAHLTKGDILSRDYGCMISEFGFGDGTSRQALELLKSYRPAQKAGSGEYDLSGEFLKAAGERRKSGNIHI